MSQVCLRRTPPDRLSGSPSPSSATLSTDETVTSPEVHLCGVCYPLPRRQRRDGTAALAHLRTALRRDLHNRGVMSVPEAGNFVQVQVFRELPVGCRSVHVRGDGRTGGQGPRVGRTTNVRATLARHLSCERTHQRLVSHGVIRATWFP